MLTTLALLGILASGHFVAPSGYTSARGFRCHDTTRIRIVPSPPIRSGRIDWTHPMPSAPVRHTLPALRTPGAPVFTPATSRRTASPKLALDSNGRPLFGHPIPDDTPTRGRRGPAYPSQ